MAMPSSNFNVRIAAMNSNKAFYTSAATLRSGPLFDFRMPICLFNLASERQLPNRVTVPPAGLVCAFFINYLSTDLNPIAVGREERDPLLAMSSCAIARSMASIVSWILTNASRISSV
jgi:hypothetical protein